MDKETIEEVTNNTTTVCSAPPYATIIDVLPSLQNQSIERNIQLNDKNNTNTNNNECNAISTVIFNNPIHFVKLSFKSLLGGIFITLFIYETDDIKRKDLLYYILLSIIAIGN